MASDNPAPRLPNPDRYITTNNAEGKAVFSKTVPTALPVVNELGGSLLRLAYVAGRPPVSFTDEVDVHSYATALENVPPLVHPGGGAIMWYIDTPPDSGSPMHRTVTLDFVVLLEGEIELTLDGGEKRMLKPGDITIQRGTMHAWRNPSSTKWTRMLGILSESQPIMVGNQTLEAEFPIH